MTVQPSYYDLHSHSTRSDGLLSPAEVAQRAASRGVQVLALTDHDELSGLAEARTAADRAGIRLIDAVEVSATWEGHTIHVVGLDVDVENTGLVEGLRRNRSGRTLRAERIAARLESLGIAGALAGACTYVTNPELVSRAHFARYLVEKGHAASTQAAFDRYLGAGKPGYEPHEWAGLDEAVEWIVASGGLPVLAHPGRYKIDARQRARLMETFKACGGVGIEVGSGTHTVDERAYWAQQTRAYGMLASVGSDFHGPRESYRDLGELPPLPAGCDAIWERL